MMGAHIQPRQPWCETGAAACFKLRPGFYGSVDCGGLLDAPEFLPSGSTVEVLVNNTPRYNGRYVIGGIIDRGIAS